MKNIDYVILKTSKTLGIPKEDVKKIVDFYWDEVHRKLVNLESTTIHIREVGTITISRYKLNKFLEKYIEKVKKVLSSDRLSEQRKQNARKNYYRILKVLLEKRNELAKNHNEKIQKS